MKLLPANIDPEVFTELRSACVRLGKFQILRDQIEGRFKNFEAEHGHPILSFGDLHDYVDANYYGGFIDKDQGEVLTTTLRVLSDDADSMPEALHNLCNFVQDDLHQWIASGDFHKACSHIDQPYFSATLICLAAEGFPIQLAL